MEAVGALFILGCLVVAGMGWSNGQPPNDRGF